MSSCVESLPGRNVTAAVVSCDSSSPSNAQKSREGANTLLSSVPEGCEETVKLAVAFDTSEVLTKSALPKYYLFVDILHVSLDQGRTSKCKIYLRKNITILFDGPSCGGNGTVRRLRKIDDSPG